MDWLKWLAREISYVGSGHHKLSPADYGFERTQPRPTKSLCDKVSVIKLEEAKNMLRQGAINGLVSSLRYGKFPKFVWFVDGNDCVYEAKTYENSNGKYHGYPLEPNDAFRDIVSKAWKKLKQEP
jgi:hypothetical protein